MLQKKNGLIFFPLLFPSPLLFPFPLLLLRRPVFLGDGDDSASSAADLLLELPLRLLLSLGAGSAEAPEQPRGRRRRRRRNSSGGVLARAAASILLSFSDGDGNRGDGSAAETGPPPQGHGSGPGRSSSVAAAPAGENPRRAGERGERAEPPQPQWRPRPGPAVGDGVPGGARAAVPPPGGLRPDLEGERGGGGGGKGGGRRRQQQQQQPAGAKEDAARKKRLGGGGEGRGVAAAPGRYPLPPSASSGAPRSPWITPEKVERLLSWEDPRASLRACAASLYFLVCLRAALCSAAGLRPASVGAFAGLAVVAWHAAARPVALGAVRAVRLLAARGRGRGGGEQRERLLARIEGALSSSAAAALDRDVGDDGEDALLAARIESAIKGFASSLVAPLVSSVAVVAHRRLSGRAGRSQRLLCGLGLWAVAAASESASSASSTTAVTVLLAAAVVVASFAAKPLADAAAADAAAAGGALRAAVSALAAADARGSALSAAAAGGGALALLRSWSVFARVSAAVISAACMLGWRLHARATANAAAAAAGILSEEEGEGQRGER